MYFRLSIFIIPILSSSCAIDSSSLLQRGTEELGQINFSNDHSAPALRGKITRQKAVKHALAYNPALQSQRSELKALKAETIQAGIPPNPELGFDVENFAGTGNNRGFDGAEITAALSQRLELGGKRSKRTLVAALKAEALRAEIASNEREVQIAANSAFTTLLEARLVRELGEQNVSRSEENLSTLNMLLEAGKSNRIDVSRAKLTVSKARELLIGYKAAEITAAAELSRIWGGGEADLSASGILGRPTGSHPANADLVINSHPAMRAASLRFARAQATYNLEKSRRISDVEVGGGIREWRDTNETAGIVELKIPLPIFDRNQGNIQAAKERIERAREDGRSTASRLRSRHTKLIADLRAARSRFAEFDSRTIESARQALTDTTEAYAAGKVSLLEVLDARETLFEVELGQVRTKADLLRSHNSLKLMNNE